MNLSTHSIRIFEQSIGDYHLTNNTDALLKNPYTSNSLEGLMYAKNWIDNVQWHLEDEIRDQGIDPSKALSIKRRIDALNQNRTDTVEKMDDLLVAKYNASTPHPNARLHTESLGWILDRLSILMLKIYHMKEESKRQKSNQEVENKLNILEIQQTDLCTSLDQLIEDLQTGTRIVKTYRQMKMYNDPSLNPSLYKSDS